MIPQTFPAAFSNRQERCDPQPAVQQTHERHLYVTAQLHSRHLRGISPAYPSKLPEAIQRGYDADCDCIAAVVRLHFPSKARGAAAEVLTWRGRPRLFTRLSPCVLRSFVETHGRFARWIVAGGKQREAIWISCDVVQHLLGYHRSPSRAHSELKGFENRALATRTRAKLH